MTTYMSIHAGTVMSLFLVFVVILLGGFTTGILQERKNMTKYHTMMMLTGVLCSGFVLLLFLI